MDARKLKKELDLYVKKNGIKYRYIAKEIGISESMLCHYRKGRRNLAQEQLQQLQKILGA